MQNRENNRGNQNQQTRENSQSQRENRNQDQNPVFLSCAAGLVPAAQLFSVLFFPLPLVFSPIS